MKVSDYYFELPAELIAQFPPENRSDSRLLVMQSDGSIDDQPFSNIVDYLAPGDLLVLNDTKVIPARLFGRKDTGGRIEILLERILEDDLFLAQIKASKAPKIGQQLKVDGDEESDLIVVDRQDSFFVVQVTNGQQADGVDLLNWFESVGHMPLPPYISRDDQLDDQDRYQTVFAEKHGAVAAPTAGLHYDNVLLAAIRQKGIEIATITLHVGAGTYQPVRVEDVNDHKMHAEIIEVSQAVCDKINDTKQRGGRVVAVGTTVVRSLETAAQNSLTKQSCDENYFQTHPFSGETEIFIYPGYEFKVVDLLQTNFHLPESTLLMLVSAFAGQDNIRNAYQHAIKASYRFFSYGDAMLLTNYQA